MGLLVEGVWQERWYDTKSSGGRFQRQDAKWRDWVTADGAPAPGRSRGFRAEPRRYHLYVSLACPWAHRTLIFRKLKRLEDAISVSIVHYVMGENGWTFETADDETGSATGDTLYGLRFLHQLYTKADPKFSGRVTVPVLWDKREETVVSNESAEIIRMLNSAFDEGGDAALDLYPEPLREAIDAVNAEVYDHVNNGVYKAGFATAQEAYEEAYAALFATLDRLEDRLGRWRYLAGDLITEADWRLFTTLARFDPVYVGHFKCNRQRIADYPNLSSYFRELYAVPGVKETVNLHHIKGHYYRSHPTVNPTRIVPAGPALDWDRPHDRERFARAVA